MCVPCVRTNNNNNNNKDAEVQMQTESCALNVSVILVRLQNAVRHKCICYSADVTECSSTQSQSAQMFSTS